MLSLKILWYVFVFFHWFLCMDAKLSFEFLCCPEKNYVYSSKKKTPAVERDIYWGTVSQKLLRACKILIDLASVTQSANQRLFASNQGKYWAGNTSPKIEAWKKKNEKKKRKSQYKWMALLGFNLKQKICKNKKH